MVLVFNVYPADVPDKFHRNDNNLVLTIDPGHHPANVGTSVEWRLNSENDSRIHGQPSEAAIQ